MTSIRPLLVRFTATVLFGFSLIACTSGSNDSGEAADNVSEGPPYVITVQPYDTMTVTRGDSTGPYGVHSFAFGETSDDKWLAIGGRVDGFHGFDTSTPREDFPNTTANRAIRLYDPGTKSMDTLSVMALPSEELHVLLSATNYQHTQVGGMLYVTGGYGQKYQPPGTAAYDGDPDVTLSTVTHPFLAVIRVDDLAEAVSNQDAQAAEAAIDWSTGDPRTAMTGGELMTVMADDGPIFYQVFGHNFNGTYGTFEDDCSGFATGDSTATTSYAQFKYYTNFASCVEEQGYANEIRRFRIQKDDTGAPVLSDYLAIADETGRDVPAAELEGLSDAAKADVETRFRRRDLPVTPMMGPDGARGFSAWGGVFRPKLDSSPFGIWAGWNDAIHVTHDAATETDDVTFDLTDEVTSTIYATAHVVLYDEANRHLYTTLLGGINNEQAWTDSVTTFTQDFGARSTSIAVQTERLPNPMGSEGEFVVHGVPDVFTDGGDAFINYASLPSGRSSIGFLFGGITTPTTTTSSGADGTESSAVIYEVFIDKP